MHTPKKGAWFRSRKDGSLPCTWQGWVTVVVVLALGYAGVHLFKGHPWLLLAWLLFVGAGLSVLCGIKVDKPRSQSTKDCCVEPDGPANGSQPIRSETDATPEAAGSRR
jgi:hypothetical protein